MSQRSRFRREAFIKQEDPSLSPDDFLPKKNLLHETLSHSDNHQDQCSENQSFKCKHCSYTAEKLSSLNRHMRIHKSDDSSGPSQPFIVDDQHRGPKLKSPSIETFCQDCRIQFSSIRTYRCHKDHYCAQRRKKGVISVATDTPAYAIFPPGVIFPQASSINFPTISKLVQDGRLSISDDDNISEPPTPVVISSPVLAPNSMRNSVIAMTNVRRLEETKERMGAPFSSPYRDLQTLASLPHPRRNSSDLNETENIKTKVHEGRNEGEEENGRKEQYRDTDEHPLDLSVCKRADSSSEMSGTSKERLTMKLDYHESSFPCNSSPSKSSSSTEPPFIKSEPRSGSPSTNDLDEYQTNHKSPHSIHDTKNIVRISNSRDGISESPIKGPIPIPLLPHPSVLVPGMAFLPGAASMLRPVPSPSDNLPNSPSGISKCNDCNIVFYKHENYLVHRKYYCSGNRRAGSSQINVSNSVLQTSQEEMLSMKIERDSISPQCHDQDSAHNSESNKSFSEAHDDMPVGDVKYKYYCVPCRIKFSNASILAAHKEYYCPAGKDSEHSVVAATSGQPFVTSENQQKSPVNVPQEFTCSKCKSVFTSARLLRLHLCDGGFPCPHCDHLAITENRLAEHIKVHAPTRAFRCTICGYRGNTARGMRMHGKSHIDEGLDFTDENMLEYHEPALMPVIPTIAAGQNSDSELLRIKNEPYKRRRSRKAYEKFDYPQAKVDIPQSCPLCGQAFPNADSLASHFKVHEIAASQYLAGLMKCIHCDYVGKSPEDLRTHFEMTHTPRNRKRTRTPSSEDDDRHIFLDSKKGHTSGLSNKSEDSHQVIIKRNESSLAEKKSSFLHQELNEMGNGENQNKVSPDLSQDINTMIPTTVKEEETAFDNENAQLKDKPNFLYEKNIIPENVSSPNNIFHNKKMERLQTGQLAVRLSPSHEDTSSSNSLSPSSSQSHISPKKLQAKSLSEKNNFLLHIKTEPQEEYTASESNNLKTIFDKTRTTECYINGFKKNNIDVPMSNSTSTRDDDRLLTQSSTSPNLQSGHISRTLANTSSPSFHHHPISCMFIPPRISPDSYRPSVIHSDETKSYCQHCDIVFTQQATYLAHKKHYCRGVMRAEKQSFVQA